MFVTKQQDSSRGNLLTSRVHIYVVTQHYTWKTTLFIWCLYYVCWIEQHSLSFICVVFWGTFCQVRLFLYVDYDVSIALALWVILCTSVQCLNSDTEIKSHKWTELQHKSRNLQLIIHCHGFIPSKQRRWIVNYRLRRAASSEEWHFLTTPSYARSDFSKSFVLISFRS